MLASIANPTQNIRFPIAAGQGTKLAKGFEWSSRLLNVLSENELIELLDQLKLGALQGVASKTDPVGHWPVLIGDGLCLSLQSAARDEFARQPEKVTVLDGISSCTTLSEVCSQYWQVHHVSTGLHDRSILIGYDRACLALLPLLHESMYDDVAQSDEELGHSSVAYDFSLAIAASLDPAAHLDGADHPVAFLPLEFSEDTRLVGGWKISIELYGQCAEFFIGLLNPLSAVKQDVAEASGINAEILVKPKTLCRLASCNELAVTLTLPDHMVLHYPSQSSVYQLDFESEGIHGELKTVYEAQSYESDADLMVQKSLQLSADDLYLLLVEAVGVGTRLRLRFDPVTTPDAQCVLPAGQPFRCVSINDLPIKNAELTYLDTELVITVKE